MARPSRTNFAENFAALLRALGRTQQEFAKDIGKAQSAVSRWLNGESEPSFEDKDAIIAQARKSGITLTVADLYADPTEPEVALAAAERRAKERVLRWIARELGNDPKAKS